MSHCALSTHSHDALSTRTRAVRAEYCCVRVRDPQLERRQRPPHAFHVWAQRRRRVGATRRNEGDSQQTSAGARQRGADSTLDDLERAHSIHCAALVLCDLPAVPRRPLSAAMPLHTLGVSLPNGRWGITFGDVMSVVTAVLYFWQPFVDHQAVMQWIIDHAFFGSVAACSILGTFVSHKLFEWGGMAWYAALYWLEGFRSVPGSAAIAAAKIDPSTAWDWNHPDKKVGSKYSALQLKSIYYILKYHAVVCIVQFFIFTQAIQWTFSKGWIQWDWIKGHPELSRADPATIPSKATVAYQCLVSTFVAETGFYWAHRLLHETRLYYWHKRHHEYKDSTVYATFYVGLLDSVITDFIPAGFGIVFFQMHQVRG